jgi:hypothetical protein
MRSRRLLLALLLSVALDLGMTVLPTPSGLQWDDEEEAVRLRRAAQTLQLAERVVPTAAPEGFEVAARRRSERQGWTADRARDHFVPRARADLSSRDLASPAEDH